MKKTLKKPLALLLCFIFLFIPSAGSLIYASESLKEPQRIGEIVELREENARAYQLDNGQIQCDIYPMRELPQGSSFILNCRTMGSGSFYFVIFRR